MNTRPIPAPSAKQVDAVSPDDRREAKELLEATGSTDLAEKAVAAATGHPAAPRPQNDGFAKRWGFASYLEMFEASRPLGESGGKNWLITNVGPEQWIVWNDQDLAVANTFKSLEEAAQHTSTETASEANTPPVG